MALSDLFTKKQVEVLHQELSNPNWQLMINYGAVRAGKTFVDNFAFLYEVRHAAEVAANLGKKHPQYILGGVSSKSIQNNVLNEITETFGLEFKADKHNSFSITFPGLPTVKIIQAYTGSIAGLGGIRGMTAYGAYINEASLANQEVFEEIRNRCSMPGSRVVCDTNPDVPTHWLKTLYIDKAKDDPYIIANRFTLDDNTFLDKRYIAAIKSTKQGMFYDRAVMGLWAAGEGLVYENFDEKKNIISREAFKKRTEGHKLVYYAGVDWGYEHKGVIVVLCDDDRGNTYLVEEHTIQHQDIDYWVSVARRLQSDYGWNLPFYCDSARPEYVQRFQDENFKADYAYKTRLLGVELLATKINTRTFLCIDEVVHDKSSKYLDELYQYVWDEKSGEPVKQNDDVQDAVRYAKATREWLLNNQEGIDMDQQTQLLMDNGLISTDTGTDPWDMI